MSESSAPRAERVSTEQKVSFLRHTEAYGRGVDRVEVIETHMSWVFLTDRLAYKLKKPLRRDFVDLRSLESRRQNCRQSVRLNRRLASDVYIGTIALTQGESGELALDGEGEVIDWLVAMHRLRSDRMLDVAIENHRVTRRDIDGVSARLNAFYEARRPVSLSPPEYLERFTRDISNTHAALSAARHGLPSELLRRLTWTQEQFVERRADLLMRRAQDGRIVEAHGDLRPEHVCLIEPPVIIDCLEFDRALRLLDPADELAYLALECERLGEPAIGKQLLRNYERKLGYALPEALVSFYALFRACLRAKIAIWHLDDPLVRDRSKWQQRTREYLHIAERNLAKTLRDQ